MDQPTLTRKELLGAAAALAATIALPRKALGQEPAKPEEITLDDLRAAQRLAAVSFTDEQLKEVLPDVKDWVASYAAVRAMPITYEVEPPTPFEPLTMRPARVKAGVSAKASPVPGISRPANEEDLAFLSVGELAQLVKSRKLSSAELTEMYLARLQRYGDELLAVVTLMPDRARADAKQADEEIRGGHYRGPLHGIPTGVKDLFATKGVPTTWGAEPYKDQVFDYDSTVVERLKAAGAVICGKLSMGGLAQGDLWFRGRTKNPWNPAEGSSGSSAGSAACVSAGLLPFAIGTETLGSIVSPSNQCRVTGLRPSYGRISRHGAMAVSWTMDKVGVIARRSEDCALVLAALAGRDPRDASSVDRPFHYQPLIDVSRLKIGYLLGPNEDPKTSTKPQTMEALIILQRLGARPVPVAISPAPDAEIAILEVEAAAAFDELTRSERINLMKDSPWPPQYRGSRFIPAVEYVQAQRARTLLMRRIEEELGDLDLVVAEGRGGHTLALTNLTGHPQVLLPFGVDDKGKPRSVSLIGRLYEEDTLLAVANAIQSATSYHRLRPDLSKL